MKLPENTNRRECEHCGHVIFVRGTGAVWCSCSEGGPPFKLAPAPAGDQTELEEHEQ